MRITESQLRRLIREELALGIHGAGMTSGDLRQRLGAGGVLLKNGGRVTRPEADQIARQIAQKKPDRIFAYSRGAAAFNAALSDDDMPIQLPPVTYLAPALFRGWSDEPIHELPPGSVILSGDRDRQVSLVQSAQAAIATGASFWVSPRHSHKSILYSRGETNGFISIDCVQTDDKKRRDRKKRM